MILGLHRRAASAGDRTTPINRDRSIARDIENLRLPAVRPRSRRLNPSGTRRRSPTPAPRPPSPISGLVVEITAVQTSSREGIDAGRGPPVGGSAHPHQRDHRPPEAGAGVNPCTPTHFVVDDGGPTPYPDEDPQSWSTGRSAASACASCSPVRTSASERCCWRNSASRNSSARSRPTGSSGQGCSRRSCGCCSTPTYREKTSRHWNTARWLGSPRPGAPRRIREPIWHPIAMGLGRNGVRGSACAMDVESLPAVRSRPNAHRRTAAAGVTVRTVDPENGAKSEAGEQGPSRGTIEVIGPEWIRTTDVASVDADGFVTIHGRADGAIIRGGFKILPESARVCSLRIPRWATRASSASRDRRLGQVPFAAAKPRPGAPATVGGRTHRLGSATHCPATMFRSGSRRSTHCRAMPH